MPRIRDEGATTRLRCRVGTSGWDYPHWKGGFYPADIPRKRWFAYYATQFTTVEINYSFYRLPDESTFDHWRDAAPVGFKYAIKANRYITHVKRLNDCADALNKFLDRCRRLGPHLGPVLYQLPPNWRLNSERLQRFVGVLPTDLSHVFEFRDDRWFAEAARRVLADHSVGFCVHDHDGVDCPPWTTGPVAYLRLHGSRVGKDGGYTHQEIRQHANIVRQAILEGRDVYAYYNNDAFGCAVRDARRLFDLIKEIAEGEAVPDGRRNRPLFTG